MTESPVLKRRIASRRKPLPRRLSRIEDLRIALRLTQAELADNLGVTPSAINQWMREGKSPSAENWIKLAHLALAVDNDFAMTFLLDAGITEALIESIRRISPPITDSL